MSTEWDMVLRDFASRVRSNALLPIVHKAYGSKQLRDHEPFCLRVPPTKDDDLPQERLKISRSKTERLQDLIREAALCAVNKVENIAVGRTVTKRALEEAFDVAVQRQCSRILEAVNVSPKQLKKFEDELETVKLQRQLYANKLKSARTRLQELDRRILNVRQEVARAQAAIFAEGTGEYPQVPPAILAPHTEGEGLPSGPGIYFLWRGDIVEYVGKSIQLSRRLKLGSHHILQPDHLISYVHVETLHLTWAECYYIGVLKPYKNFGRHASHYREGET